MTNTTTTTTTAPVTTCQICGRAIKANTGRIAHHGYRRPSAGWQTRSCMGARYLPYEVSCDRLPIAIASVDDFVAAEQAKLDKLVAEPPAALVYQGRSTWGPQPAPITVSRPEWFDATNMVQASKPRTYEHLYHVEKYRLERSIRESLHTRTFLADRLSKWAPPASTEGK